MSRLAVLRAALLIAFLAATGALSAAVPTDPLFVSAGTWQQSYADQWWLHRIGFTPKDEEQSAWRPLAALPEGDSRDTIVAIIDTGVDFTHPDLARENLWSNPQEKANGIDDDRNGYIDDLIGWNFADANNNPWDRAGHGTHIAGIIAAHASNGVGIAGINPRARIMSLKVLNAIGRGRSSHIAAAIHYAVANGARVINLSLGGENLSAIEQRAVQQAAAGGVLVVVAAGNLGRDTAGFGLADLPGVLTVAATDTEDRRAAFSNFGKAIKVSAPGTDILSLRARDTDLIKVSGVASYRDGAAAVGEDYYRVSGTSFAAAIVSGTASWLLTQRPQLTGPQVARMLMQSAHDIGAPGVDPLTGYGLINAAAALVADSAFHIEAAITDVDLSVREGVTRVRVLGSCDADRFVGARLMAAPEAFPEDWIEVAPVISRPVRDAVLGEIETRQLRGPRRWVLRVVSTHESGRTREARYTIDLGEAK